MVRGFAALAVLFGISASPAFSQAPAAPPPDAPRQPEAKEAVTTTKEKLDYYLPHLERLRLAPAGSRSEPFQFVSEPLTAFENPISDCFDGMMFVWTDQGRPAAAMKCYYQPPYKHWGRTFVSLSSERIELTSDGKKLWTPAESGLSFAPLPDASEPADDPRRRLSQMRQIARRFTMVDHWGLKEPTKWQLRLLPTPLYRYELPEADVVDGALFGYVVNSPEALVLIEARKTAKGLAWYYAVARFTRFEVTVSLDGNPIAEFPRLDAWPPTGVYFHHPLALPDYPFERTQEPAEKQ